MLINRVKLFTNIQAKESYQQINNTTNTIIYENIGSSYSSICCIVNCPPPLADSKDYKTLTKVFKKLMMNIDNIYVVNINGSKSTNFIHFIHEFNFNKIFIFGDDALMNNIPFDLKKMTPTTFERYQILLVENLTTLTSTQDTQMKLNCWDAITNFYKA